MSGGGGSGIFIIIIIFWFLGSNFFDVYFCVFEFLVGCIEFDVDDFKVDVNFNVEIVNFVFINVGVVVGI